MDLETNREDEEQECSTPLTNERSNYQNYEPSRKERFIEFCWWFCLTLINIYNWWTLIFRETFEEIQTAFMPYWFSLDAIVDIILICDLILEIRRIRDKSTGWRTWPTGFYLDIFCLVPLDFLQFVWGVHPMLRFPRLLKVYKSYNIPKCFTGKINPKVMRLANLIHGLILFTHWKACLTRLTQTYVGDSSWVYTGIKDDELSLFFQMYRNCFHGSAISLLGGLNLKPRAYSVLTIPIECLSPLFSVLFLAVLIAEMVSILNCMDKMQPEMDNHTRFATSLALQLRRLSPEKGRKLCEKIDRIMQDEPIQC